MLNVLYIFTSNFPMQEKNMHTCILYATNEYNHVLTGMLSVLYKVTSYFPLQDTTCIFHDQQTKQNKLKITFLKFATITRKAFDIIKQY